MTLVPTLVPRSKRSYAVGGASRREGFTLRYRYRYEDSNSQFAMTLVRPWRLPLGEDSLPLRRQQFAITFCDGDLAEASKRAAVIRLFT